MKSARAIPAVGFVLVLFLSSMGATGLSTWKEGASDFPSGQNSGTATESGSLVLAPDPSLPGNWTGMGDLSSPPPRYAQAMVGDSISEHQVLFGGAYGNYYRNDTWTYDSQNEKWTLQGQSSPLRPRMGQAMTFDGTADKAVLFGGNDGTDKGDTWTYDLASNSWTEKSPANPPSTRTYATFAYDYGSGLDVLFGGEHYLGNDQSEYYADTWTYEASKDKWKPEHPTVAPVPRSGASLVNAYGQLVLFGGRNDTAYLQDTWTYNATTGIWTNRNPPSSPPSRAFHSAAPGGEFGKMVLFGGQNSVRSYNDTWVYDVLDNTWTRKLLSAGPTPRHHMSMSNACDLWAVDPSSMKVLLFGGMEQGGEVMDDYWAYDIETNAWTQLGQLSSPPPRIHHALAYDSAHGVSVLFGGWDTTFQYNDTWLYNASKNLWTRQRPSPAPAPRLDHMMAYDTSSGLVVLFGGSLNPALSNSELSNDTWTYNVGTNTWTKLDPPSPPEARMTGLLACDSSRNRLVLFGGSGSGGLNDTWTFDVAGNTWTDMTPGSSPTPRSDGAMAYDSARRVMVLFSGDGVGGYPADTWTYDLGTNSWTDRNPPLSPGGRRDSALAFDSVNGRMMLFGGLTTGPGFGDTWAYNTADNSWTDLAPAMAPSARFGHDMVFDARSNVAVLFGGSDPAMRGDTWLYGVSGRMVAGTYISKPKDTGGSAYFGSLAFQSSAGAGESVRLQLRTGANQPELENAPFAGPDGTAGSFYAGSGARIAAEHNGSRWVQYCASLESPSILQTPYLQEVSVEYNLIHTLQVLSPAGGENWSGDGYINWSVTDPDNDFILVDIYLVNGSDSSLIATDIPAEESTLKWSWYDTPNGTYRVRLVARDPGPAVPLSVDGLSAEFTVFHEPGGPPPPSNHPPLVFLSYPADTSVLDPGAVTLRWTAIDADGDSLNYTVFFSTSSFDFASPPPPAGTTTDKNFTLSNLTPGQTYFWSVRASDGQDNGTGPVWRFSLRVPSVNGPPRFTSTPPANATVGVEYIYPAAATDPDGDPLLFGLLTPVAGLALNATSGRLVWTPGPNQKGTVRLSINVTDGKGGSDTQSFNVTVGEPPYVRPGIEILHPSDGWIARGLLRISGLAANGTGIVIRVQVRVDGGPWADANATGSWGFALDTTKLINGRHTIEARSFDGEAYSHLAYVQFYSANPEPSVSLEEFPWNFVILGLWIVAGAVLFWEWARHREGVPPPT